MPWRRLHDLSKAQRNCEHLFVDETRLPLCMLDHILRPLGKPYTCDPLIQVLVDCCVPPLRIYRRCAAGTFHATSEALGSGGLNI